MRGRGVRAGALLIAALACSDSSASRDDIEQVRTLRRQLEECRVDLEAARADVLQPTMADEASGEAAGTPESEREPVAAVDPDAPLVALRTIVRRNSAGTSEVTLMVRNRSRKTIDAFRFSTELFNGFNERIVSRDVRLFRRGTDPNFRGAANDATVRPGQERRVGTWSAFDHEGAVKGITTITQVHFSDNSTWEGAARQEHDPREPEPEPTRGATKRHAVDEILE